MALAPLHPMRQQYVVAMTPGQKIGSWTCIGPCETPKYKAVRKYVSVRCDCGKERPVAVSEIVNGNSRSCGCVNRREWRGRIKSHVREVEARGRAWRGE
jgi:hypothetical protein